MTVRAVFTLGAAAAIAFAAWGSLFPFAFEPVSFSTAVTMFVAAWGRGPAGWSISDFSSNVLLFVPIGLCALAALQTRGVSRSRAMMAVLVGSVALSALLELAQAFIRWRTSSIVDVAAEQVGTALGIVLWIAFGRAITTSVERACAAFNAATLTQRILIGYCLAFAVAWLLPLDVTLRPGEIADKAFHQRLLLPFTPSPDAASLTQLAVALLAALPIGAAVALWGSRGLRGAMRRALVFGVPGVLILELCQVFVFSRTTDGTIVLPLSAGVLAGAAFVSR